MCSEKSEASACELAFGRIFGGLWVPIRYEVYSDTSGRPLAIELDKLYCSLESRLFV